MIEASFAPGRYSQPPFDRNNHRASATLGPFGKNQITASKEDTTSALSGPAWPRP
ncbi:hypothetical protein [Thiocapsa bogorovii]|uniref:hypothetical protein n=1 Tax=Thiocapsa bogorovii TaxID=521689 RepID=UPI001E43CE78|nr:hypothetical protein [Thiocapsa bogorovii]UHD17148.1 hypothetical protein LT988_03570 [Thiocapsa bogorovii]